jgi:phospholipid-binding lipoprotein MlaA
MFSAQRLPRLSAFRRLACGLILAGLLLGPLAGCATRPPATDPEAVAEFKENNDPAEPFNRSMYDVHQKIDRWVLRPVAVAYRDVVPAPVRVGISNVLGNLRTPVILLNDILQGEPSRAGATLGRFAINTVTGWGGIFDVALHHFHIPGHTEDWGQTLARWGVGEGPYLFLPVLGPSNPRDLVGFGLGIASDPLTWLGQGLTVQLLDASRAGVSVIDTREQLIDVLDAVEKESLDPYALIRSAYRQRRAAEISNSNDRTAPPRAGGTGFGVGVGMEPPK